MGVATRISFQELTSDPYNQKTTGKKLHKIEWDVISLCEVRRKGEGTIRLRSGNVSYEQNLEELEE